MVGEASDPLEGHLGRVVVLLAAQPADRPILRGLSRLSRLDFLLRFPMVMERVATLAGVQVDERLAARPPERLAVETELLRWKFGVWDDRYRTLVGQLVGRQIAELVRLDRPMSLRLTPRGSLAEQRLSGARWALMRGRARFIAGQLPPSGRELGRLIEVALTEELA